MYEYSKMGMETRHEKMLFYNVRREGRSTVVVPRFVKVFISP